MLNADAAVADPAAYDGVVEASLQSSQSRWSRVSWVRSVWQRAIAGAAFALRDIPYGQYLNFHAGAPIIPTSRRSPEERPMLDPARHPNQSIPPVYPSRPQCSNG